MEALIAACARAASWGRALALLQQARGEAAASLARAAPPGVVAHSAAINACARGSRWQHAQQVFVDMMAEGVAPNAIACNAVINACEKSARWEQAIAWLAELPAQRLRPTVISFNTAISACSRGKRWTQAVQLVEQLEKEAHLAPNSITLAAVLSGLDTARQAKDGSDWLAEWQSKRLDLDTIAYNVAISACEKGQAWASAFWLLQQMRGEEASSSSRPDVLSYNAAASSLEMQAPSQWWRTAQLLQQMRIDEVQADAITYNSLIAVCERGQQWHCSLVLWEEMLSAGVVPTAIGFNAMLGACSRGAQWARALQFLCDMPAATATGGPGSRVASISAGVSACEHAGRWSWCAFLAPVLSCQAARHSPRGLAQIRGEHSRRGAEAVSLVYHHTAAERVLLGGALWARARKELSQHLGRLGRASVSDQARREPLLRAQQCGGATRMHDPVLEAVFTVGATSARAHLQEFDLEPGCWQWCTAARSSIHQHLQEGQKTSPSRSCRHLPSEPEVGFLAAWVSGHLQLGRRSGFPWRAALLALV